MDNTGPGGSLNTDKVSVALLQYYNTPLRGINQSPAQLATGRQLRDGIPTDRKHYNVSNNWKRTLRERETQMAETHQELINKRGNSRVLPKISAGARVMVQNQLDNRWDKSGTIMETLDHRQYTVKMDGSGRLTRRNRKHLKVISERPITTTVPNDPVTQVNQQVSRPRRNRRHPNRLGY